MFVSARSKYATNNLRKGSKTDDINIYGASFASDGNTPTGFSNNFISGGPSKGLQKFQWVQVRRIEPWMMVDGYKMVLPGASEGGYRDCGCAGHRHCSQDSTHTKLIMKEE